jgi:anion-transporting  ArsA/GET3 family ATPase
MGMQALANSQSTGAIRIARALETCRLVLVTGKGGVGRTTVTAALARAAVERGRRVLVADIGEPQEAQCPLALALQQEKLSASPQPVAPGLRACHINARRGQELFFTSILNFPSLVKVALGSKALRKFLDAAPSFEEMGQFYHLLRLLQQEHPEGGPEHELIIVDMPATGHALALTELPRILERLIPGGPIHQLLQAGQDYIHEPELCVALVVTLPEMLPISEALELVVGLRRTEIAVGGVILNRVPSDPFSAEERDLLDTLLAEQRLYGSIQYHRLSSSLRACQRLYTEANFPTMEIGEHSQQGAALIDAVTLQLQQALDA